MKKTKVISALFQLKPSTATSYEDILSKPLSKDYVLEGMVEGKSKLSKPSGWDRLEGWSMPAIRTLM